LKNAAGDLTPSGTAGFDASGRASGRCRAQPGKRSEAAERPQLNPRPPEPLG